MKEVVVNRNFFKDNCFSIIDYDFNYVPEYIYNNTIYLLEDHYQMDSLVRKLIDEDDILGMKGEFYGRGLYILNAMPALTNENKYIITIEPVGRWFRYRLAAQKIRHKMLCDNGFNMADYIEDFRHLTYIKKMMKSVYDKVKNLPTYPEMEENVNMAELNYFSARRQSKELQLYIDSGRGLEKDFKKFLSLVKTEVDLFDDYLYKRFPKELINTEERYRLCRNPHSDYVSCSNSAYNWTEDILLLDGEIE